jgi:WD40 repeat protein
MTSTKNNAFGGAVGRQPEIYLYKSRQQYGPYPESTVREWLRTGQCGANDLGWRAGMKDWQPLATLLQSRDAAQSPVVRPQEPPASRNETSMESKAAGEATSECNDTWSSEETAARITGDCPVALSRSAHDSHVVAVCSKAWGRSDEVVVANATQRKTIESFKATSSVQDVRFSHDGSRMAVCLWSSDHDVEGFIINAGSKQRIGFPNTQNRFVLGGALGGSALCAFSADDNLLAVAEGGMASVNVTIHDTRRTNLPITARLQTERVLFQSKSLEWSPDGSMLAQAGSWAKRIFFSDKTYSGVLLWRFVNGVPQETLGRNVCVMEYPTDSRGDEGLVRTVPFGMAFLQGSQLLAVGSEHSGRGSTIKVFNLETHTLLCESENIGSRTCTIVQSTRDDCFFSGGLDGVLRMWELKFEGGSAKLNEISSFQFPAPLYQCIFCEETNSLLGALGLGKCICIQHIRPPLELTESSVATRAE